MKAIFDYICLAVVAVGVVGFWFQPAATTCLVTGSWRNVDPNCKLAFEAQKTYDQIGMTSMQSVEAYYKVSAELNAVNQAFGSLSILKQAIDEEQANKETKR